jgi:hypothetical protein
MFFAKEIKYHSREIIVGNSSFVKKLAFIKKHCYIRCG